MFFSENTDEIIKKISTLLVYNFKFFLLSVSKNIEIEDSTVLFFKVHNQSYKLIRQNIKEGNSFMPKIKRYFALQEMTNEVFNKEVDDLKNNNNYICLIPIQNNNKNGFSCKGINVKNEKLFPNMEIIGDETDVIIIDDIAIVSNDQYYFGFYYNYLSFEKI